MFRIDKIPHEMKLRRARLASRATLAPRYVRVRVAGEDLVGFDSPGSDDHMRLFFPGYVDSEDVRQWPGRMYTPVAWDGENGWIDYEFVVHEPASPASTWAAEAEIGSEIAIGGPRGSRIFTGMPESYFLAGDETALPAMRRFADALDGVPGTIVLLSDDDTRGPLDARASAHVVLLPRGPEPADEALVRYLESLGEADRPSGDVFGFVAGEQSLVKAGRALLLERWRLGADQTNVKGYWKSGEAGFGH